MRKLSDSREEHGAGRNVEMMRQITCHFSFLERIHMVVCADHRTWCMEGTPLGGDIRGRI